MNVVRIPTLCKVNTNGFSSSSDWWYHDGICRRSQDNVCDGMNGRECRPSGGVLVEQDSYALFSL